MFWPALQVSKIHFHYKEFVCIVADGNIIADMVLFIWQNLPHVWNCSKRCCIGTMSDIAGFLSIKNIFAVYRIRLFSYVWKYYSRYGVLDLKKPAQGWDCSDPEQYLNNLCYCKLCKYPKYISIVRYSFIVYVRYLDLAKPAQGREYLDPKPYSNNMCYCQLCKYPKYVSTISNLFI